MAVFSKSPRMFSLNHDPTLALQIPTASGVSLLIFSTVLLFNHAILNSMDYVSQYPCSYLCVCAHVPVYLCKFDHFFAFFCNTLL